MEETAKKTTKAVYSKEQLLGSRKYAAKRDLLSVLLLDDKEYSFDEVDKVIEKYMKGKVK